MVSVGTICTALFVPANRPERFGKAAASGTDAVILDLEDAVAADAKKAAREQAVAGFTDLPVLLRINPVDTLWHEEDLAVARAGGFAAVILPKAEDPTSVATVARALQGVPLVALVETARGLAHARGIAEAGAVRLAFGSIDYCADLGCAHRREVLLPVRTELVLASRLAGIAPPLDGVTLRLEDLEEVGDDAAHARSLGMTGKLCIHPNQVGPVLDAFRPTVAEVDWARRVLSAGEGAVVVDGAMVDSPVRLRANSILAALRSPSG